MFGLSDLPGALLSVCQVVVVQALEKLGAGHLADAQRCEVIVHHLAIKQVKVPLREFVTERGERTFRGVGCMGKHGFTKEHTPQGDAIESSHEGIVAPGLYTVREPGPK